MNSGKDTVARILVEECDFKRIALADSLKSMAYTLNPHMVISPKESLLGLLKHLAASPVSEDALSDGNEIVVELRDLVDTYGWDTAKTLPPVREMLQRLGHGGRERLGDDIWIKTLQRAVEKEDSDQKIVVPDIRYDNEAAAIKKMGGVVIHVRRQSLEPDASSGVHAHPSEHGLSEGWNDLVLENNGTIEELREKTLSVFEKISI